MVRGSEARRAGAQAIPSGKEPRRGVDRAPLKGGQTPFCVREGGVGLPSSERREEVHPRSPRRWGSFTAFRGGCVTSHLSPNPLLSTQGWLPPVALFCLPAFSENPGANVIFSKPNCPFCR